jgi:hypothetical protein
VVGYGVGSTVGGHLASVGHIVGGRVSHFASVGTSVGGEVAHVGSRVGGHLAFVGHIVGASVRHLALEFSIEGDNSIVLRGLRLSFTETDFPPGKFHLK